MLAVWVIEHVKLPSNINLKNMAGQPTPQEQIVRLLSLPGVREETRAVLGTLLGACEDENRLSEFILESVLARLSARGPQHIAFPCCSVCRRAHPPTDAEAQLRSEALNEEGNRWLADFLLYSRSLETRPYATCGWLIQPFAC